MGLDSSRPPPGSPRPSEVSQPREAERGGPGGRCAVIGLLGARPSARRVGTGRGQLLLGSGVRAPIDPAAAEPRLSPSARGGRCRSAELRWGIGASFHSCRRHLRVFGAGRREGTRGCSWSGLLSVERASLREQSSRSPLPPPRAAGARPLHPPAQPGSGRREKGAAGGGRSRLADSRWEETPARSVRPRAQCAPPPGLGSRSGRKGLRRGRCHGGGPGHPGAKLWGLAAPDPIPFPSAPRTQVSAAGSGAAEPPPPGEGEHACPCQENFSC